MNGLDLLGVDWGEIGKHAAGGVHTAGKVVLSAFGAGSVASQLENLESKAGILPDWAKAPADVAKAGGAQQQAQQQAQQYQIQQQKEKEAAAKSSTIKWVIGGGVAALFSGAILWRILR